MAEYDNTNSGALYENDRKTTDNHPDRTGAINTTCPNCGTSSDHWLSGWLKKGRDGTKLAGKRFLSLASKAKGVPAASAPKAAKAPAVPRISDDIPF